MKMFNQFKNITLTLLILAIGLGQPLAASLDVINVYEIEASDEKEIELKEGSELFSSKEEKTFIEPHYRDYKVQLASYVPYCSTETVFISSLKHSLYLLYDTWLV